MFEEDGPIDWAHAEALALASLLALGVPVRLTGQDTERGTFSQRHAVLHDSVTGERYTPLQHLRDANAPFELHNSPLSEQACMGFEYGYSVQAPDARAVGGAVRRLRELGSGDRRPVPGIGPRQVGPSSRLSLLLPTATRLGPRALERARGALPAGCGRGQHPRGLHHPPPSTSICCRQALVSKPRPLILMTPKSLLRLPAAVSTLAELAEGSFHRVLDDPASRTIRGARR